MGMFDWIDFAKGRARFDGSVRGADDDPHYVLAVELDGSRIYYGDFEPKFEEDHTHYNVEIITFGFGSRHNVGNPVPTARVAFSPSDVATIETLIRELMLSPGEKPSPLKDRSTFLGGVAFKDGWLRKRPVR
jgi:hypothetical protein